MRAVRIAQNIAIKGGNVKVLFSIFPTMKAEHINPFLKSTIETFKTMVGLTLLPENFTYAKNLETPISLAS